MPTPSSRLGFFAPLNEAEWLACADVDPMMRFLSGIGREPKARKLRLFACACCRRSWRAFSEPAAQHAVKVAELAADRRADRRTLGEAARAARSALTMALSGSYDPARYNAARACDAAAQVAAPKTFTWGETWRALAATAGATAGLAEPMNSPQFGAALACERAAQADVFRHLVGNPFHDPPRPRSWPMAVLGLARSLYAGEACHAPLHDALLEVDQPGLAAHFLDADGWHPRGCWVLDLILGKSG